MNAKLKRISKSTISIVLTLCMILSCLTVGIVSVDAVTGKTWKGNIYFRAPDTWDIDTNSVVQVLITRTTSANTNTYLSYGGDGDNGTGGRMTRMGTSRLFHIWIESDHSNWGQDEKITFTANSDAKASINNKTLSGNNTLYMTPLDMEVNNDNGFFLFIPSNKTNNIQTTNGNVMTGTHYDTDVRVSTLKATQTVKPQLTTDGGATGTDDTSVGKIDVSGFAPNNTVWNEIDGSTITNSTDVSYDASEGSLFTLTAKPSNGYEIVGWYDSYLGSLTKLGSTTYSYYVRGARTVYPRFKASGKAVNVTAPANGSLSVDKTTVPENDTVTITATPNAGYELESITVTKSSGGTVTVTNNQFTMPDDVVTVSAVFRKIPVVTAETDNSAQGTAEVTSQVTTKGGSATIKATPKPGYMFKQWNDGNTSNPRTISSVNADVTYTAAFEKVPFEGLSVKAVDDTGAELSVDGLEVTLVQSGDDYVVTTNKDALTIGSDTYNFIGWESDNGQFTNAANLQTNFLPTSANAVAKAVYATKYVVTITQPSGATIVVKDSNNNTVSNGDKISAGETLTVTVTPSRGKKVGSIQVNSKTYNKNTLSAEAATQTISVDANTAISANIVDAKKLKINVGSSNGSMGKVKAINVSNSRATVIAETNATTTSRTSTDGAIYEGDIIELTATVESSYKFTGWGFNPGTDAFTYQTKSGTTTKYTATDATVQVKIKSGFYALANFGETVPTRPTNLSNINEAIFVSSSKETVGGFKRQETYDDDTNLYIILTAGDSADFGNSLSGTNGSAKGVFKPGETFWVLHTKDDYTTKSINNSWGSTYTKATVSPDSKKSYVETNEVDDVSQKYAWKFVIKSGVTAVKISIPKKTDGSGYLQDTATITPYLGSDGITDPQPTFNNTNSNVIYAKNGTVVNGGTHKYGIISIPSGTGLDTDTIAGIPGFKYENDDTRYKMYYYNENNDLAFTVRVKMNDNYAAAGFGVLGFSVSGTDFNTSFNATDKGNGVFEADVTIAKGKDKIQITPVYYNKAAYDADNSSYARFQVKEPESDTYRSHWGYSPAYYTWYGSSRTDDLDGSYPGQPLLKDSSGMFYALVAKKYIDGEGEISSNSAVNGVLFDNFRDDKVQKEHFATAEQKNNYQTYDYADPIGILGNKGPNYKTGGVGYYDIVEFDMKYKSGTSHQSDYSEGNHSGNGQLSQTKISDIATKYSDWEMLTNLDDVPVNILGMDRGADGVVVDDETGDNSANYGHYLYVVSVGNQDYNTTGNNEGSYRNANGTYTKAGISGQADGQFSTVWMVYDWEGNLIAEAPASYFIKYDDSNPFYKYFYDSTQAGHTYYNNPVKITYEVENGASKSTWADNEGIRLDGRWLFASREDDTSAHARIATLSGGKLTFFSPEDLVDNTTSETGKTEGGIADMTDKNGEYTTDPQYDNRTTAATMRVNVGKGYKFVKFMKVNKYVADNDKVKSGGTEVSYFKGYSTAATDYVDVESNGTLIDGMTIDKEYFYVAIVEKIPATDLVLTHEKYGGPGNHGGNGLFYVSFEGTDKNGSSVTFTDQNGATGLTIENFTTLFPYNASKPDATVKVKIKTVMAGTNTFVNWYQNADGGYKRLEASEAWYGSNDPAETEFELNINDLYAADHKNLLDSAFNFYSDIELAGTVNISHNVLTGSKGTGVTYNQVTVVKSDKTTPVDNTATFPKITEKTSIKNNYIKYNTGNYLKIELTYDPDAGSNFLNFHTADLRSKVMESTTVDGIQYVVEADKSKATVYVPIDYFFDDSDSENVEFDSAKKDLDFFSSFSKTYIGHTLIDVSTNGGTSYSRDYYQVDGSSNGIDYKSASGYDKTDVEGQSGNKAYFVDGTNKYTEYAETSGKYSLKAEAANGYTFDGWFTRPVDATDDSQDAVLTTAETIEVDIDSDKLFIAKFTQSGYTATVHMVLFDGTEYALNDSLDVNTVSVTPDEYNYDATKNVVYSAADTTKYEFLGWATGVKAPTEGKNNPAGKQTQSYEYWAVFKLKSFTATPIISIYNTSTEQYTNTGAASYSSNTLKVKATPSSYNYGADVEFAEDVTSHTGYVFKGWSDTYNPESRSGLPTSLTVNGATGNVTRYAIYETDYVQGRVFIQVKDAARGTWTTLSDIEAAAIASAWFENGAKTKNDGLTTYSSLKDSSSNFVVNTEKASDAAYTFKGWAIAADGENVATTAKYEGQNMGGSHDFYARYEANKIDVTLVVRTDDEEENNFEEYKTASKTLSAKIASGVTNETAQSTDWDNTTETYKKTISIYPGETVTLSDASVGTDTLHEFDKFRVSDGSTEYTAGAINSGTTLYADFKAIRYTVTLTAQLKDRSDNAYKIVSDDTPNAKLGTTDTKTNGVATVKVKKGESLSIADDNGATNHYSIDGVYKNFNSTENTVGDSITASSGSYSTGAINADSSFAIRYSKVLKKVNIEIQTDEGTEGAWTKYTGTGLSATVTETGLTSNTATTSSGAASLDVAYGNTADLSATGDTTDNGYTFDGWYLKPASGTNYGSKLNSGSKTATTAAIEDDNNNCTYVARFSKGKVSASVQIWAKDSTTSDAFVKNDDTNITVKVDSNEGSKTVFQGTEVTISYDADTLADSDYSFVKWQLLDGSELKDIAAPNPTDSSFKQTINANTVYVLCVEKKQVTVKTEIWTDEDGSLITYGYNHKTNSSNEVNLNNKGKSSADITDTVDVKSTVTLAVPTVGSEYTFDGWFTQSSGGTALMDSSNNILTTATPTIGSEDITYYARFSRKTVSAKVSIVVNYDGDRTKADISGSGLTAGFSSPDSYTTETVIPYDSSKDFIPVLTGTKASDVSFVDWYVKTGSGNFTAQSKTAYSQYPSGSATDNYEFVAVFKKLITVDVEVQLSEDNGSTYAAKTGADRNGNTATVNSKAVDYIEKKTSNGVKLEASADDAYTFVGWYVKPASGDDYGTKLNDYNGTVDPTADITANTTYVARFKRKQISAEVLVQYNDTKTLTGATTDTAGSVTGYTASFVTPDSYTNTTGAVNYNDDSEFKVKLEGTAKAGYKFAGWYVDSTEVTSATVSTQPTHAITDTDATNGNHTFIALFTKEVNTTYAIYVGDYDMLTGASASTATGKSISAKNDGEAYVSERYVDYDASKKIIVELGDTASDDYQFAGWYIDGTKSTTYNSEISKPEVDRTENHTVIALYLEKVKVDVAIKFADSDSASSSVTWYDSVAAYNTGKSLTGENALKGKDETANVKSGTDSSVLKNTTGVTDVNTTSNTSFTAVTSGTQAGSDFVFAGWYYKNKDDSESTFAKYATNPTELEKVQTADHNYSLVALYVPAGTKTFTVTHNIITSTSPAALPTGYKTGTGKSYVKIEIIDEDGNGIAGYEATFKENSDSLPASYIKSTSDDYIKVTIKTDPDTNNEYHASYSFESGDPNGKYTSTGSTNAEQVVITKLAIKDLFKATDPAADTYAYYSDITPFVQGDVKVMFADSISADQNDWTDTVSGQSETANFTNTVNGTTVKSLTGNTSIKIEKNVENFVASTSGTIANSDYKFAGWYKHNGTSYEAISDATEETYSVASSADVDLVALYVKADANTADLVINHKLYDSTVKNAVAWTSKPNVLGGTGTFTATVKIKDKDGTDVTESMKTAGKLTNNGEAQVTIDKSLLKETSDYTFDITLTTTDVTTNADNRFVETYYNKGTDKDTYNDNSHTISGIKFSDIVGTTAYDYYTNIQKYYQATIQIKVNDTVTQDISDEGGKVTAKFTGDSESDTTTSAWVAKDKTDGFEFTATWNNNGYTFVGWEKSDTVTTVTTAGSASASGTTSTQTGSQTADKAYTITAKFQTVSADDLSVLHTLKTDSAAGTPTVEKWTVYNSDDEKVISSDDDGQSPAKIPGDYIKSTDGTNYIVVELKTTPTGRNRFAGLYYNGEASANKVDGVNANTDNSAFTYTSGKIDVSSLYDGSNREVDEIHYYSDITAYVNSTVQIKYNDNSTANIDTATDDTMSGTSGTTTGATVKFANNSTTSADYLTTSTDKHTLTTVEGTNSDYIFSGWYVWDADEEKYVSLGTGTVTPDNAYPKTSTLSSQNANAANEYVALYVKAAKPELTIKHNVITTTVKSDAKLGTGTTRITKVEYVPASGSAVDLGVTAGSTVTIAANNDNANLRANSTGKLKITLTAQASNDDTFLKTYFDNKLGATASLDELTSTESSAVYTATKEINISDLFSDASTLKNSGVVNFYSEFTPNVKATVAVKYADTTTTASTAWTDSATGSSSENAWFVKEPANDHTKIEDIVENNGTNTFGEFETTGTVSGSAYVFAGWKVKAADADDYSDWNNSAITANKNYSIVALYVKAPAVEITINHNKLTSTLLTATFDEYTTKPEAAKSGSGTVKVTKVEIVPSTATATTGTATVTYTNDSDSYKVNVPTNTNQKLRITLTATAAGIDEFNKTYYDDKEDSLADASASVSGKTGTTVKVISISDLLNNDGKTNVSAKSTVDFYSDFTPYVNGKTFVRYADSDFANEDDWTESAATGKTAGDEVAEFDTTNASEKTDMTLENDGSNKFKLKAGETVATSDYEFANWYAKDSDDNIEQVTDSNLEILANDNYSFYALFVLRGSKSFTVNHTLLKNVTDDDKPSDIKQGSGTTSVKLEVVNASGNAIAGIDPVISDNTASISDASIIKASSDYYIKVTLISTASGHDEYNSTYAYDASATHKYSKINGATATYAVQTLIKISDLFAADAKTTYTYYSDFTPYVKATVEAKYAASADADPNTWTDPVGTAPTGTEKAWFVTTPATDHSKVEETVENNGTNKFSSVETTGTVDGSAYVFSGWKIKADDDANYTDRTPADLTADKNYTIVALYVPAAKSTLTINHSAYNNTVKGDVNWSAKPNYYGGEATGFKVKVVDHSNNSTVIAAEANNTVTINNVQENDNRVVDIILTTVIDNTANKFEGTYFDKNTTKDDLSSAETSGTTYTVKVENVALKDLYNASNTVYNYYTNISKLVKATLKISLDGEEATTANTAAGITAEDGKLKFVFTGDLAPTSGGTSKAAVYTKDDFTFTASTTDTTNYRFDGFDITPSATITVEDTTKGTVNADNDYTVTAKFVKITADGISLQHILKSTVTSTAATPSIEKWEVLNGATVLDDSTKTGNSTASIPGKDLLYTNGTNKIKVYLKTAVEGHNIYNGLSYKYLASSTVPTDVEDTATAIDGTTKTAHEDTFTYTYEFTVSDLYKADNTRKDNTNKLVFYSDIAEKAYSTVKIMYNESADTTGIVDGTTETDTAETTGSTKGNVTKATVYFDQTTKAWTSEDYDITSDAKLTLKAEEQKNGEYIFSGWYKKTATGYEVITGTDVSTDTAYPKTSTLSNQAAKESNEYVALFVKAPAKNLTINHSVITAAIKSDAKLGSGTTKITKIEYVPDSGSKTVIFDGEAATRTITNNNIRVNNTGKLAITLEANATNTSTNHNKFVETYFDNKLVTPNTVDSLSATKSNEDKTGTVTYEVEIKDLFNGTGADAALKTDTLDFYSDFVTKVTRNIHVLYRTGGSYNNAPDGFGVTAKFTNPDVIDGETSATFDKNDGTFSISTTPSDVTYNGTKYEFQGWFIDDNRATADYPDTNVTDINVGTADKVDYYAIYSPKTDVTLGIKVYEYDTTSGKYLYKVSEASGAKAYFDGTTDSAKEISKGVSTSIKFAVNEDDLEENYVFKGWAEGTENTVVYSDKEVTATVTDAKSYYALYMPKIKAEIELQYSTDGGTNYSTTVPTDADATGVTGEFTAPSLYENGYIELATAVFGLKATTRTAYRFDGWYVNDSQVDGTAPEVSYRPVNKLANLTAGGTVKFVARFTRNSADYKITYKFTPRNSTTQQSYVVSGTLVGEDYEKNHITLTAEFIKSKAPYESIFDQEFKWNMNTMDRNGRTAVVYSSQAATKCRVTFSGARNSDGSQKTISLMQVKRGEYAYETGTIFVNTAAAANGEYFQYWKIKNLRGDVIGYCYNREFNFAIAEDSNVEAVYAGGRLDPSQYQSGKSAYINLLEVTRNQWTKENGDIDTDKIWLDFNISFMHNGDSIITLDGDEKVTYGYVLEIVGNRAEGENVPQAQINAFDTNKTDIENALKDNVTTTAGGKKLVVKKLSKLSPQNRILAGTSFNNKPVNTDKKINIYSYMIDADGTVTLSENYISVCMNEIALKGAADVGFTS